MAVQLSVLAASAPAPRARIAGARVVPGLLLLASILFNPLLAIVNGNVTALTPGHVVLAELAIVGTAHLVILRAWRPQMASWYALIGVLIAIAALRSAAMGQPEIKALRDVLLIPTFVMLGMVAGERRLVPVIVTIHVAVLSVLALEWTEVDLYAEVFRIRDYYINTRGYTLDQFTNVDSELYISADRPEERVFSFVGAHRMSSLFLEPVSLGNYCIIMTAFCCAYWRRLSAAARVFLATGNLVVLVACDGRLAIISILLIVAVAVVAMRLPARTNLLYLPALVASAALLVALLGFHAGNDDFPGRIAYTVELLGELRAADLLGVSAEHLPRAVDSGVAHLVLTQSIFGSTVLWLAIVLLSRETERPSAVYGHAVCIYLALTMLVSYSFLSIKTAALLWFVMGALQGREPRAGGASVARPAPRW